MDKDKTLSFVCGGLALACVVLLIFANRSYTSSMDTAQAINHLEAELMKNLHKEVKAATVEALKEHYRFYPSGRPIGRPSIGSGQGSSGGFGSGDPAAESEEDSE